MYYRLISGPKPKGDLEVFKEEGMILYNKSSELVPY